MPVYLGVVFGEQALGVRHDRRGAAGRLGGIAERAARAVGAAQARTRARYSHVPLCFAVWRSTACAVVISVICLVLALGSGDDDG